MAVFKQQEKTTPFRADKSVLFDRIINVTLFKETEQRRERVLEWESKPRTMTQALPGGRSKTVNLPFIKKRKTEGGWEYAYYKRYKNGPSLKVPEMPEVGPELSTQNDEGWAVHEYDVTQRMTIVCPYQGPKPDITVHFAVFPGYHCYKVDVDIKNLHVNIPDIRQYRHMLVEVGYRGLTRKMLCSIFSSYIMSPGPDGITRFHTVAVGDFSVLQEPRSIVMNFGKRKVTIQELIEQLSLVLQSDRYQTEPPMALVIKYATRRATLGVEIDVPKKKTFSNGAQAITWVNDKFDALKKSPWGKQFSADWYLCASVVNNELTLIEYPYSERDKKDIAADMSIVRLDRVNHATFSGPKLTLTAPYVPNLKPGDLFKMSPNYIDGALLPNNDFAEEMYRGIPGDISEDVYRIITMQVDFSTVGSANEMQIMGIPLVYDYPNYDLDSVQKHVAEVQEKLLQQKDDVIAQETQLEPEGAENVTIKWWEGTKSIPGTDYLVDRNLHPGDVNGLHDVASRFFAGVRGYYKSDTEMGREAPFKVLTTNGKMMVGLVADGQYFWPLIAVATYHAMMEERNKKERVGYHIDLAHPDMIRNGWYLKIPTLNTKEQVDNFANNKDVFYAMSKLKAMQPDGMNASRVLGDIYVYMGGTWH